MRSVPFIDINELTKYYGKVRALDNISMKIDEGEIFGFIGPNGAGKTTAIRILMNLIFPTSGNASVLGMDVIRQTKEIKQVVGYVPSDAGVYSSMDVNEFFSYCAGFYGLTNATERIRELSGLFGLELSRKVSDLSMGNRKKVSIVQSLLHSPKVLILDEPTTGLDPLMQSVFFQLLQEENRKGMTILFSSHVLAEVQMICGRVAVIREGRIIRTENIETLRRKQLKKVYIEFPANSGADVFYVSGMVDPRAGKGNSIHFMYSGDLNDLTRALSVLPVTNLMIEEPSLEEIFMHFYK
jgi:ABC-2 type transport system ATP-binding protein